MNIRTSSYSVIIRSPFHQGNIASSVSETITVTRQLDGEPRWMIKAQLYAGGRRKADGVKRQTH